MLKAPLFVSIVLFLNLSLEAYRKVTESSIITVYFSLSLSLPHLVVNWLVIGSSTWFCCDGNEHVFHNKGTY